MLSIEKSFSLSDFERCLDTLYSISNQALRLPNSLKADAAGGQAALIQLIITWARQCSEIPSLKIYADAGDSSSIAKFANSTVGLIALNFAKEIVGYHGVQIDRGEAMETAIPFVEKMHSGRLSDIRSITKTTIPLFCVDNARRLSRPNRLYNPGSEHVRSRRDFENLFNSASNTILPQARKISDQRLISAAASLIYEAFLNTHEHAQTDALGVPYRRSVRGILIGSRYIKRDHLHLSAAGHRPIQDYFRAWRPDHAGAQHGQFVEISIFDSGAGLAQTWLQKKGVIAGGILENEVSIDAEFDAVLGCFRKGGTTKMGETSGNGLFRIMRVVSDNGGFIRVRSGRLSLIHVAGVPDHSSIIDEGLEDSVVGGRPVLSRPWVDGTVITAMLPLNRERNK